MRKIFIYYSFSNNGEAVSNYLKNKGYDIRRIKVKKDLPNNFFLSILTGGYKSLVNYKEKLVDFDNNIDDYDEILIGSPIWNDRLSSPITTLLDNINLEDKRIKFILYSGSGQGKHANEFIKSRYPNANIIHLKEPKKNKEELNKISE